MQTFNYAKANQQEREWERLQDKLPGGPGFEEQEEEEECPNLTTCERKSCRGCRLAVGHI